MGGVAVLLQQYLPKPKLQQPQSDPTGMCLVTNVAQFYHWHLGLRKSLQDLNSSN